MRHKTKARAPLTQLDKENIPTATFAKQPTQLKTKIAREPLKSLTEPETRSLSVMLTLDSADDVSDCLVNHQISGHVRAQMVDWMIEVTCAYRCNTNMFFQAVRLLDRYFKLHSGTLQASQVHSIGLASMLVASKFSDFHEIGLEVMVHHIAHDRVSKEELAQMEAELVSTVWDKLTIPTCWEILRHISEQLDIKGVCLKTAEVCLVLWSVMLQHLNLRPGVIATSALIIASRSLGLYSLAASVILFTQMPRDALEEVVNVLHKDILEYPRNYTFLTSAMTFWNFDFKLKEHGPLFTFQDMALDAEQAALMAIKIV
mmetsp:Transcript_4857/g.9087  ORF Transcript_4857/g.9087 Transcript_4857/m.9087 type:complete len:316 (-) Transcript_4857:1973-2920(-)